MPGRRSALTSNSRHSKCERPRTMRCLRCSHICYPASGYRERRPWILISVSQQLQPEPLTPRNQNGHTALPTPLQPPTASALPPPTHRTHPPHLAPPNPPQTRPPPHLRLHLPARPHLRPPPHPRAARRPRRAESGDPADDGQRGD